METLSLHFFGFLKTALPPTPSSHLRSVSPLLFVHQFPEAWEGNERLVLWGVTGSPVPPSIRSTHKSASQHSTGNQGSSECPVLVLPSSLPPSSICGAAPPLGHGEQCWIRGVWWLKRPLCCCPLSSRGLACNMIKSWSDVCEKQKAAPCSGFSPSDVACQRRRDRTVQITERRAATPASQPASPRSFCSPEYNLLLVHKGNKGEMFNSCSVGQDKCKHFCSDNLQTSGGKAPG